MFKIINRWRTLCKILRIGKVTFFICYNLTLQVFNKFIKIKKRRHFEMFWLFRKTLTRLEYCVTKVFRQLINCVFLSSFRHNYALICLKAFLLKIIKYLLFHVKEKHSHNSIFLLLYQSVDRNKILFEVSAFYFEPTPTNLFYIIYSNLPRFERICVNSSISLADIYSLFIKRY